MPRTASRALALELPTPRNVLRAFFAVLLKRGVFIVRDLGALHDGEV